MQFSTVAVFGASGRQGQAQVRELAAQGFHPRAISRHKELFATPAFQGIEVVAADYADSASLDRACQGVDAIFFQPPQVARPDQVAQFCANLGEAAKRAGIKRFILNSTMWAPDQPCGQPIYDGVLAIENLFAALGFPLIILRPTLYMDNWLTAFAKPALVNEHKYRYPHKPGLRFSPLCLEDVAKFMVAGLKHDEMVGKRIRIAGPETITPEHVAECLSDAMGVRISHEYITPLEFGRYLAQFFADGMGIDAETYAGFFDYWYSFNNDAPQQPFCYDVSPLLKQVPIKLKTFREWAQEQDWTTVDDMVGSITG